jgi:uncharacterized protein
MSVRINIPDQEIVAFCRKQGIRRLALFGSVLGEGFRPDSDVDVLVEFEPVVNVGLFSMAAMELELTDLFGRKVDLRTPADLSRYFRDEVLAHSRVLYAA